MSDKQAEYSVSIQPAKEIKLTINEELEKKITKHKPWFLIMNESKLEKNKIIFFDEKTKTETEISSDGKIVYNEMIILENEVDLVRTIAIICGVLKLAKIVYSNPKFQDKIIFSLAINSINNREILRNENLAIYGEIKINQESIEIKKEIVFDKNFYALDAVKEMILDFCQKIDFPIDDALLEKEIKDAIEVLDNPMKLITKL
ncbi:MAG: hypothetical protein ACK4MM_02175 [Fervidobacterium sp.]